MYLPVRWLTYSVTLEQLSFSIAVEDAMCRLSRHEDRPALGISPCHGFLKSFPSDVCLSPTVSFCVRILDSGQLLLSLFFFSKGIHLWGHYDVPPQLRRLYLKIFLDPPICKYRNYDYSSPPLHQDLDAKDGRAHRAPASQTYSCLHDGILRYSWIVMTQMLYPCTPRGYYNTELFDF